MSAPVFRPVGDGHGDGYGYGYGDGYGYGHGYCYGYGYGIGPVNRSARRIRAALAKQEK